MHEHLLIDTTCYYYESDYASVKSLKNMPFKPELTSKSHDLYIHHLDGARMYDDSVAIQEVSAYKNSGGNSLVDTTSIGIGRDPLGLARISRGSKLNIIMGSSYYVTHSHPPDMDQKTQSQITDEIIRDITIGVKDTNIRSGIIGEVGNFWPLTQNEIKVLLASGKAQRETGAPITIHSGLGDEAPLAILNHLIRGGAKPTNCIIGHLDTAIQSESHFIELAKTGCYLEFDIFGWENTGMFMDDAINMPNDTGRLDRIIFLIENGFEDQIVISQDVCRKWHLSRNGGQGYDHILNNIVPRMKKLGITESQITKILIKNPAKALVFE
jgi:phosphotriesterase-related protein